MNTGKKKKLDAADLCKPNIRLTSMKMKISTAKGQCTYCLPINCACPLCPGERQHSPTAQSELSDIFAVRVMILNTRNEKAPAWPLDSGISLMNWTTKPC